jgi:voltage-gated potassium channel
MYLIVQILKQFSSTLRRENLHRVAILVLAMIVLASVLFWYFEAKLGFPDALWWTIVTLTTVGYGDISPTTAGGRIVGVILMVFGIGFLGVLTATFASIFIENKIMENRGMKAATVEKHIVICGWNYNGPDIVAELRADQKSKDIPIVVIAQLNDKPLNDSKLQFIRGDVRADVLEKANVKTAQAVIMLSDDKLDPSVSDAKIILGTLSVKSLYPDVYVCVELFDAKNVEHCERANADEIIIVGELGTNLLVQAALDHGITRMITELVSNRYGDELYKIKPPNELHGKTFLEVLNEMKKRHNILCIGIENNVDHRLISNPDAEYVLSDQDEIVVIAEERPEFG